MSDLADLYQEVILDHNRRPRNYGALEHPDRQARGHNPLCGDRVGVSLRMDGDRIADVRFEGAGCAISRASASLMTEAVRGRTVAEVADLFERFTAMITAPLDTAAGDESLGKLTVLGGVREFPIRIKCASLPWHTLKAALAASDQVVATE
ncbi:MAG: SUF system NifU family Fe-S cluster assembly protein [Acidobacteria bacterium]|nr:SUF system NifU family Fe-S cluster assembly protein [Acidobacteriota bacterium]